jgi:preprotein translocase subunit YajC
MLSAIKKHDKVITSGGIFGVVAVVNDNDVILKIDESNNVRIKVTRSAIATIVRDETKEDSK